MKRNKNKVKSSMEEGFVSLVDSYTSALENNSSIISSMLDELTKRELTEDEKKSLRSIEKDLKRIDKGISNLGI